MTPGSFLKKTVIRAGLIFPFKLKFCAKYLINRGKTKTILTFPQKPHPNAVLYRICHSLGYKITRDQKRNADLLINWEDCTYRRKYEVLEALNQQHSVINIECNDISKKRVEEVHQEVFGYGLAVNPTEYIGPCVKKSNDNATHDGEVIEGPINATDEGSVYQRVVHNIVSVEGKCYVEDIRVPVFNNLIPFCYLKRRLIQDRFSNENVFVRLCERETVLSAGEVELLLRFCQRIGLDYGELDVLRDADNGKLFVVDVNNTPFGPPNHLDPKSTREAMKRLSKAFVSAFLTEGRN